MFKKIIFSLSVLLSVCAFSIGCHSQSIKNKTSNMQEPENKNPVYSHSDTSKVTIPDKEWQKILSPEVYNVAREKGTERPYSSKYEDFKGVGTYYCAVCGNPLFKSNAKFDSGCGWPSFFEPISKSAMIYQTDNTHGMHRTEVLCGRCKSHLGHIFDDGPQPTGLRYCMNGIVLDFKADK